MTKIITKSVLICFIFAMLVVQPVMAGYIDPNTGGMLFQILAVMFGVFSGLMLIFSSQVKKVFYRAMRFLRGSKEQPSEDMDVEQSDESQ
jgi:hypothetical protein